MVEILFVLLTVYVVYVVQSVVCKKDSKKPEPAVNVKPVVVAEAVKKSEKKTVVEKPKSVAKNAAVKKTRTTTPKVSARPVSGNLRNPKTGDVDKIAASYRMTKRWIKEALVTEDLLPKIYKTAELDDAAKLKINKALVKLAKMDKYQ